ncbi:MAG TPA: hypothetical protein VF183_01395, partial [Acidimicrobiales bacterium]
PVLYRRTFTHPGPARPDGRLWLRFEGVFSQGDVWLDGSYAGDTEGYFVPHAFEVTDQLAARRDHALAVEVGCPSVEDSEPKRALTGAYQDSAHLAPGANPGGIWRPVRIVETGPVSIRHGRVVCRDATEERATLGLRLVLDSPDARPVRIRTQVAGVHHELEQPLAAGENRVEWTVTVNNPVRWWPHTLGPSPLHDVRVDVCIEDEDDQLAISDSRTWRTGFRSIELRNWICRVNGERLFLKGANLSPLGPYPADATPSELRAWVREARDAGLDLLRVHTHIAPPELYRAADELGMLLWQDLPMHGRYARTVRREAVRQAREAVDLLGHHPSVALWCAHDEPYAIDRRERRRAISPGLLPQQLPTWNRSILDRSVKRVLAKSDGSRPVIAHSGVLPHLPRLDGTDAHVWFGWYGGVVEDLASFASTLPRQVRFVSAFGAQALPDPRPELRAPDGRPDWEALAALGIEVEVMQRVLGLPPESSLDDWVAESHAHQAMVVRRTIETLRRLKYRPTGGFSVHRLADPQGRAGFGLLDSAGRPKPAWASFVAATQPVIVVADPPPATIAPGATVELAVHVVSDERVDRPDSEVTAEVTTPAWQRSWRWKGDVHADACVLVGRVRFTAPVTAGPVTLDLRVNAGEVVAVNRYVSRIG